MPKIIQNNFMYVCVFLNSISHFEVIGNIKKMILSLVKSVWFSNIVHSYSNCNDIKQQNIVYLQMCVVGERL